MTRSSGDNCGTCEFNQMTLGPGPTSRDDDRIFCCEIRDLVIDTPFWTTCYNHQRRNPLLTRRPRGPLLATISGPLRDLELSERIQAIPELVPPHDLGPRRRVPYWGEVRPLDSDSGQCQVCQEITEQTISLHLEDARRCFCSVSHYLMWWLDHAPNAGPYRLRKPVASETLYEDLLLLSAELEDLLRSDAGALDARRAYDILGGLEGIIIQAGHGYVDLAQIPPYLASVQDPDAELSPHLLQMLLTMAEIPELARAVPPDWKAIRNALQRINRTVQRFLQGKPYRGEARRGRWWQFWRGR